MLSIYDDDGEEEEVKEDNDLNDKRKQKILQPRNQTN